MSEIDETVDQAPIDFSGEVFDEQPQSKRRAFSRLKRELSEEELSQPGVQKMLLALIEEAEETIGQLKSYQSKFHNADKELAIANGKLEVRKGQEILYLGATSAGALFFGYLPNVWSNPTSAVIFGIGGAILFTVGCFAKWRSM
jgi:hypothetical protein